MDTELTIDSLKQMMAKLRANPFPQEILCSPNALDAIVGQCNDSKDSLYGLKVRSEPWWPENLIGIRNSDGSIDLYRDGVKTGYMPPLDFNFPFTKGIHAQDSTLRPQRRLPHDPQPPEAG